MSANMYIVTERRQDVLVAPNRAVRSQGEQRVVAVLKGTELEWVPVETGAYNDTMTEIVAGLEDGQTIVANPPNPPTEGRAGVPAGIGPGMFRGMRPEGAPGKQPAGR